MSYYDILLRLGIAILIGIILGGEREYTNRPAGLRTHILVCVGATVISMIQVNIVKDTADIILKHPELGAALKSDMGRLGAQVISGIGFLGVGTIIHQKGIVKGLTTAANIWITACIGLAVGMGYYFLSFASVTGVYITVVIMKKLESTLFEKTKLIRVEIEYNKSCDLDKELRYYFKYKNIEIKDVAFYLDKGTWSSSYRKCLYTLLVSKHANLVKIQDKLSNFDQISKAEIQ